MTGGQAAHADRIFLLISAIGLSQESLKLLSLFQRKQFHQICSNNQAFYNKIPVSQVNHKVTFQFLTTLLSYETWVNRL